MFDETYFKGRFVTHANVIQQKLQNIKVFIFDWDGVFNDGRKDINGNSSFSEVDSMGVNMMRFSHYLLHKKVPVSVIITGENNKLAIAFAKRENFNAVFYKTLNKKNALDYVCNQYNIQPGEVLFVFDDVLDFSVAQLAGVRCMTGHFEKNLLTEFAVNRNLVDYITGHDSSNYAVREVSELIMALAGNFEETIESRMHFSDAYKAFLDARRNITTEFFTTKDHEVIKDTSI